MSPEYEASTLPSRHDQQCSQRLPGQQPNHARLHIPRNHGDAVRRRGAEHHTKTSKSTPATYFYVCNRIPKSNGHASTDSGMINTPHAPLGPDLNPEGNQVAQDTTETPSRLNEGYVTTDGSGLGISPGFVCRKRMCRWSMHGTCAALPVAFQLLQ